MLRGLARGLVAIAALAASWLAAPSASAQMAHIPENDWRQEDRHDALAAQSQRPGFAFEIRFGPYMPRIDSAFTGAGAPTPFADVFGLDCSQSPAKKGSVSQRLVFGLEADVLPLRIPYVGAIGIGLGWSFTRFGNQAAFSDRSRGVFCSAETTSLTIMPMHASVVLRIDELMRRTRIPIVPYAKIGPSFSFWRATGDSGTERICGSAADPHKCTGDETPVAVGAGWTPGMHFAVGGMISLNFIDPRSTARLSETSGIGHVYVFGEFYSDAVAFGQKVLHVGTTSGVAGLAADF